MEFAIDTTTTEEAWQEWDGSNFAVSEGSVEIAPAPRPSYITPEAIPADVEPVDLATDECGDLYLLTATGEVYRYDPVRDDVDELTCTWRSEEAGTATGIAVTRESIFIAGSNGHLQAYARQLLQTRWSLTDPFDSPVALDTLGEAVMVLDEGADGDGSGFLASVERGGANDRVVTGLTAPLDLATDGETTSIVAGPADGRVISLYDPDFEETDTITVPDSLEVTCLEIESGGDVLVGVGPGTAGEPGIFRYVSDEFDRLDGLSEESTGLALSVGGARGRVDGLYAIAGDPGEATFLERVTKRRRNPTTGRYDAQLLTRIDSGEPGTEWHRVTTGFDLANTGTQLRLRYVATDDETLEYTEDSMALEAVDGIGRQYADRLRSIGVRGLSELIEQSPESVASAVSTETLDVSPARAEGWIETGRTLLADREGPVDLEAIDGIGSTFAGRLRNSGIADVAALVERNPAAVARIVSQGVYDVPPQRTSAWIDHARQLLAERNDIRGVEWTAIDPPNPRDALLTAAEGRYLWVELDLIGDQYVTPRVDRFRAYFPRKSYLRYLPAVYQDDPESAAFLEQFLSIFESVFTDIEEELETMTRYLDPAGAPSSALEWLGDWLALEAGESWPEGARRELISRAPSLFKKRGTREGLLEVIRLYLRHATAYGNGGMVPVSGDPEQDPGPAVGDRAIYLLEHSDLDCIDDPEVRQTYERSLPCPQCFLVLIRSRFDEEAVRTVRRIVDRERPAHAVGRTVQLRPWIQLGGNSYLGINTRLPHRDFTVEESSLGNDSVLGSREPFGQVGIRARIGTDATIS